MMIIKINLRFRFFNLKKSNYSFFGNSNTVLLYLLFEENLNP